jgi:hypothetical protein
MKKRFWLELLHYTRCFLRTAISYYTKFFKFYPDRVCKQTFVRKGPGIEKERCIELRRMNRKINRITFDGFVKVKNGLQRSNG